MRQSLEERAATIEAAGRIYAAWLLTNEKIDKDVKDYCLACGAFVVEEIEIAKKNRQ